MLTKTNDVNTSDNHTKDQLMSIDLYLCMYVFIYLFIVYLTTPTMAQSIQSVWELHRQKC
jgi:hypothetical protein